MREILFRGKRVEIGAFATETVCEWVYGGYAKDCCSEYILSIMHNPRMVRIDPSTVGQYTGLTDKVGTKVFEHDCIKQMYGDAIGVIRYGIHHVFLDDDEPPFDHVGFYVDWVSGNDMEVLREDLAFWLNRVEIIGNVYDNPELLI